MTDKQVVVDMDPSACEGCPYRVDPGANTDRPVIDKLAQAETAVLGAVSGENKQKCGLCGCPLVNLSLFNRVPTGCPRVAEHGGER
jgi:hypothetical protein